MPVPQQPYELSRHGWISIEYDQNVWIPCPPVFPEGLDRHSWAELYAEEWWARSGRPHGKRELKTMAKMLSDIHAYAYSNMAMHRAFLHLPGIDVHPLLVSFGIWEAVGDRDTQLRTLTHVDDPALIQPAVVEEFSTGKLGPGIKVRSYTRDEKGAVTESLDYAWRSDELSTAVRMFTGSPDLARLEQATSPIDALAQSAAWVPLDRDAPQNA